jgi:hypothetical protein
MALFVHLRLAAGILLVIGGCVLDDPVAEADQADLAQVGQDGCVALFEAAAADEGGAHGSHFYGFRSG